MKCEVSSFTGVVSILFLKRKIFRKPSIKFSVLVISRICNMNSYKDLLYLAKLARYLFSLLLAQWTQPKLNVLKTFIRCPGRLLIVLCTLNLDHLKRSNLIILTVIFEFKYVFCLQGFLVSSDITNYSATLVLQGYSGWLDMMLQWQKFKLYLVLDLTL